MLVKATRNALFSWVAGDQDEKMKDEKRSEFAKEIAEHIVNHKYFRLIVIYDNFVLHTRFTYFITYLGVAYIDVLYCRLCHKRTAQIRPMRQRNNGQ
jgi:hypothetical protein